MKHTGLTANEDADRLFVCTFPGCGKCFKTKFSMTRHGLVHSQEKNFVCEFCGKRFALLQYLKEHTNTHTSAKPYVCGVAGCQERFSQTGKLSLHRRTHPEYALKEYHSNASYNKKPGEEENSGSLGHPEGEAHTDPDKKASAKEKTDSDSLRLSKSGLTARKEVPARHNSASACAGNEESPPGLFVPQEPAQTTPSNGAREELTSDAEIDSLLRYLSYLQTPFSSVLRPVLPLPEGVRTQRVTVPHTALNLFELINKAGN